MVNRIVKSLGLLLVLAAIVPLLTSIQSIEANNEIVKVNPTPFQITDLTDHEIKALNFIPELAVGANANLNTNLLLPLKTSNTLFKLLEGDSYTSGFTFDRERYAYIGTNTSPARIIKYDLRNMKRVTSIDLPAGRDGTSVSSLFAINPQTIIHASFTNPTIFTKIDGTTMKITGTLYGTKEGVNDKFIRSMTYDGKYVFAATDSTPSKILKIDPVSMKMVDTVLFNELGINEVHAITVLDHYLVGVSGSSENAAIFRLDLKNLHHPPDLLYVPGHSNYFSLATDGKYIYAGTYTNPVRVVKVNATSKELQFIGSFIGEKDKETANFSIVFDGEDIIVGTWNYEYSKLQDKLIKINRDTLTRKETLTIPSAFPAHLISIGPYIYTSTDQPTGEVLRVGFRQ
jgi:hypothetical protein